MGRNRKKPVRHRLEKRQKRSRQKKKSGLFDKVTMLILVVAVCVFAFSLYQLVRTMMPYYSGGKEYDKLKNKAITVQEQTDDPGDVSGDTFKVDFDVLLQENPDTVAWIRFDEPSIISYPVVKSADNKEYLTKTRAMAVDMETATLFSCGFANHIPTGALLLVSDQPMTPDGVKTDKSDNLVTRNYVEEHVEIGIASLRMIIDEKKTVKHLKFDW